MLILSHVNKSSERVCRTETILEIEVVLRRLACYILFINVITVVKSHHSVYYNNSRSNMFHYLLISYRLISLKTGVIVQD